LSYAVTPNFLKKRIISENYSDPRVFAFLTDIRDNKNVSVEFKQTIDLILSGKYLTDIKFGEE
jgi:hypothetical protein